MREALDGAEGRWRFGGCRTDAGIGSGEPDPLATPSGNAAQCDVPQTRSFSLRRPELDSLAAMRRLRRDNSGATLRAPEVDRVIQAQQRDKRWRRSAVRTRRCDQTRRTTTVGLANQHGCLGRAPARTAVIPDSWCVTFARRWFRLERERCERHGVEATPPPAPATRRSPLHGSVAGSPQPRAEQSVHPAQC